jgi:hypothetical protein
MAMGYPDEVINPERGKVKEGTSLAGWGVSGISGVSGVSGGELATARCLNRHSVALFTSKSFL